MQAVAEAKEYEPAKHKVHEVGGAERALEYFPAAQSAQFVLPAEAYVPLPQLPPQLAEPAEEKKPPKQRVHAEAASLENVPEGQEANALDPVAAAYEPAGALVHAADPAAGANVPAAHGVQAVPAATTYRPAPQGVQAVPTTTDPVGQLVSQKAAASDDVVPVKHAEHEAEPPEE